MYAKNISEFILCRRDEQNARTSTIDIKGAIEVITQCLGQVAAMGSWILVHSAMKSASAYDLMVGLLLNSME